MPSHAAAVRTAPPPAPNRRLPLFPAAAATVALLLAAAALFGYAFDIEALRRMGPFGAAVNPLAAAALLLAAAAAVAAAAGARFFAIECTAPAEEVRRRLVRRQAEGSDPWSDGRWEVYLAQAAAAERWPESDVATGIRVDTTAPRVTVLDAVLTAMARAFGLLGEQGGGPASAAGPPR